MSVIDPTQHAELIALQRAVWEADATLYADTSNNAEPLREKVREAAAAKETALYDSGLVQEHGYYRAAQDLKDAAKTAS